MIYTAAAYTTEVEDAQREGYATITNTQISTHRSLVDGAHLKNLNFDSLKATHQEGHANLISELLSDNNKVANRNFNANRRAKVRVVAPISQGLTYIDGELCHVGDYPNISLITVLQGPHRGMQTTLDYNGVVLCVNLVFFVQDTPAGIVLRHEYPGTTVKTGVDQVVIVRY